MLQKAEILSGQTDRFNCISKELLFEANRMRNRRSTLNIIVGIERAACV